VELTESEGSTDTYLYPGKQYTVLMVNYTYDEYQSLLTTLYERGYSSIGYAEQGRDQPWVLLRHDVDYDPSKALEIAEIEAESGMQSTFFFLLTTEFYNVFSREVCDIVDNIVELGHDIGLHFDTSHYWDKEPDVAALQRAIRTQQEAFEAVCDSEIIDTVAFHNPPEWTLNRYFDGLQTTYEPEYFEQIAYESDSLYRWKTDQPFGDGYPNRLQVLTHPVLWGEKSSPLKARIETAQQQIIDWTDRYVRENSDIDWEDPSEISYRYRSRRDQTNPQ
jgi:peptidoglycan/xylan/chitin deacetylase (PgdA/CDA1 family)